MTGEIVSVRAECSLTLTEKEVVVLYEYLCYEGAAKRLHEGNPRLYTLSEVEAVLHSLRDVTDQIMRSADGARQFLFDERYGKR